MHDFSHVNILVFLALSSVCVTLIIIFPIFTFGFSFMVIDMVIYNYINS